MGLRSLHGQELRDFGWTTFNMDIKYLIDKYGEEFRDEVWYEMPYSQYSNLSSMLLYALIREHKFKRIFEMGCERKSRSSFIIQYALQKNMGMTKEQKEDPFFKEDFIHYMCDFPHILDEAVRNLRPHAGGIAVAPGDATKLDFDYSDIDFLFIDAHHEKWFAAWYLDTIIPQLKEGTLVHIHDIYLTPKWTNRMDREMETEELIERHKKGTLNLEKLFWMVDLAMHDKETWEYIANKFPFIGDFPAPVLPHGDGTTYWKVSKNEQH